MRTHPGPFAISVSGATVFSAAAVGVPLIIGRVTDNLIAPAFDEGVSSAAVLAGVGAVAGVGLIRGLCIVIRRYFASMVEARMQATLRRDVVDAYLDVPLAFHHANPTGELLAHADADVIGTTTSIKPLTASIGVITLALFALVSLASVDWTFAVVALVLFPALAVINRMYTSRVHRPVTEVQHHLGVVSSVAHESFDGAMVVKTLGLADLETDRFAAAADRLRTSSLEVGRIRANFDPILDALPALGTLALFVVGGWRIDAGAVTAGDLVSAALLFSILAMPLRIFGFFLQELPRAVVSVQRVDAVTDEPHEIDGPEFPTPLPAGPLGLQVTDVVYSFDDHAVLRGVSFDVEAGTIVALVGATGSGKSTLLDLLAGLTPSEGGRVSIGGVDLRDVSGDDRRDAIAMVFQEAFLFADSLGENVTLGAVPLDDPVIVGAAATAQVTRFLPVLPRGWDTTLGERGVTLSGGQRQRVALARALARRPRILLLDDATSAVDPLVEAEILAGLRPTGGDPVVDMTVLIVAHRLSTIRLADRVIFLDEGRIVAAGTHDELLANPEYEALVTAYEREEPVT